MRRRSFLATMGSIPLLPALLARAGEAADTENALIILWMDGGMSHLDTFDGKPEAPLDIRGDLASIASSLEDVFVSSHLRAIGQIMDRCCLIRSITSPEGNHDRGSHYMLTGRRPSPVLTYPSFGSLLGPKGMAATRPIPRYVAIPDAHPYARQGFLPAADGPFELGGDPGRGDYEVRHLTPAAPMDRAMALMQLLDHFDGSPRSSEERARDRFIEQARYLSLDPEARRLFDLKEEPAPMHQRYGRHSLGQSCLLARRLIEGGVRTVLVRDTGWDHHQNIAKALTYGFPPKLEALNQAVPALYHDLEERGILERVTVVLASEFGRTPRLNPSGGRDHWSRASSVLLFGGGLKSGQVVGKTDARGEEPIEAPVSPADLFVTILAAMKVDAERILKTPDGRPVPMVSDDAHVVEAILA